MTNIKRSEMGYLNDALWMGSGYVLDFSDRTFAEFFDSELGIDIEDERYRRLGSSKAKRLRCFLQTEGDSLVAKVLRALWAHRERVTPQQSGQEDTEAIRKRYFEIVHRLEGGGSLARTDPIDRFARDETLEELVAAIERDIAANKPQVVLDRLHTYCMKKFGHLLKQRGLEARDNDTLNARAGRLFNPLRRERGVRPISDKIMRTTVETFELFNTIRNNESLAHDNDLVPSAEARFIFDAIVNLLRFLKSIEADHFGA
ncbi:MAG: abortive infection family protein [Candidatus Binatales bacterium]